MTWWIQHNKEMLSGKRFFSVLEFLMIPGKVSSWASLSHRRPAKAQASLRIRADSPEPSLLAHMKYESRRGVQPKIRHLVPLDGCTCGFEVSLWQTKSTIISWDGSFYFVNTKQDTLGNPINQASNRNYIIPDPMTSCFSQNPIILRFKTVLSLIKKL